MNTVVVNGKKYSIPDGSISVIGNKIYVNGKLITDESGNTKINIVVNGSVNGDIKTDCGDIKISGNCNNVQTISGDIECGDVNGNVQTTSGDIKCKNVKGSAKSVSGDITTKKFGIDIR